MATRQLLSFAVVGTIGFVVDAAALYAAMHVLGAGLYAGRVLSYLCGRDDHLGAQPPLHVPCAAQSQQDC